MFNISHEATCRNQQLWARLLLSFLVGWSSTRLSHQPRPKPTGTSQARCQLELKGSSELEAAVQPARNLGQREQKNQSHRNPHQLESIKTLFPRCTWGSLV